MPNQMTAQRRDACGTRRIIGGLSAPCRATRILGSVEWLYGRLVSRLVRTVSTLPLINTKSRAGRQAAVAPSSERRRHHLTVAAAAVRPWKGPGWPGEGLVSAAATSCSDFTPDWQRRTEQFINLFFSDGPDGQLIFSLTKTTFQLKTYLN